MRTKKQLKLTLETLRTLNADELDVTHGGRAPDRNPRPLELYTNLCGGQLPQVKPPKKKGPEPKDCLTNAITKPLIA